MAQNHSARRRSISIGVVVACFIGLVLVAVHLLSAWYRNSGNIDTRALQGEWRAVSAVDCGVPTPAGELAGTTLSVKDDSLSFRWGEGKPPQRYNFRIPDVGAIELTSKDRVEQVSFSVLGQTIALDDELCPSVMLVVKYARNRDELKLWFSTVDLKAGPSDVDVATGGRVIEWTFRQP